MKFTKGENLISVHTSGDRLITFFISPFPTGQVRNFRCLGCGKLICQYEGDIIAGVDGGEKPKTESSIEILCTRCRIMYRLIS